MTTRSHVDALDRFTVEHRDLDAPVVLLCREDRVVEVYVVDDGGLEQFAGFLDRQTEPRDKVAVLLRAISTRVKEDPVSARAHAWLSALRYQGLLT